MSELKVLSVASEIFPLVKTGGLADVAGALPGALAREGVEMRTLVPGYPAVHGQARRRDAGARLCRSLRRAGARARRQGGRARPVRDRRAASLRPAGQSVSRPGRARLARQRAPLRGARAGRRRHRARRDRRASGPQVVHAHDWQAALAPAYLHYAGRAAPGHGRSRSTTSPFRAIFRLSIFAELGLPASALTIDGVEYFGGVGYLKAGLRLSDRITTVSPTYAREIMTPEFGMALDGLLRTRAAVVQGIVNGIDDAVWNPGDRRRAAADLQRAAHRHAGAQQDRAADPDGAGAGRRPAAVRRRLAPFGSEGPRPAVAGAARRSSPRAASSRCSARATRRSRRASPPPPRRAPDSVGCVIGYDEKLAHLIQAGADFIVVPSRFEPCGLTQLCALRYGAAPIVARVGGLADTVIDANEAAMAAGVATGVQFSPPSVEALAYALDRALEIGRDPATMRRLRLNGMRVGRLLARSGAAIRRALSRSSPGPARMSELPARPRRRRRGARARSGARPAQRRERVALPLRRRPRGLPRADGARRGRRPARRRARLRRGRALRLSRRGALRSGAGRALRRLQAAGRPLRLARSTGRSACIPRCSRSARTAAPFAPKAIAGRAAGGRAGPQAHRVRGAHHLRAQPARLLAPEPGDPRGCARDLRRPRASGLDRASRGARRHRGRDHAGRRVRRRAAPAAARPLERLGLQSPSCSARPIRGLRRAAGPRCARRPTRCTPRAWRRSSTSSSTTTARATSSGRRCRSAASTTPPGSASIPATRRSTSTTPAPAIAWRSTGRWSSTWRSARSGAG